MRLLSYYKIVTSILCLISPLLIGVTSSQAAEHSIYLEWTYHAPPEESIHFFSLYMDDNVVCQTSTPADRSMNCEFEAPNGTYTFYLSAQTDKGESPLSPPFPFTLNATVKSYSLTYRTDGNGSIEGKSSQTIVHGTDGTSVEAIPAVNHHFIQWNDGSMINPRIDSNVTESSVLTAAFSNKYTLNIKLAGDGSGSVTSTLTGVDDCATDCSVDALQDSLVTLTAVASNGYKFMGWSSDQCTGTGPCTIRVEQHLFITAIFEKRFPWGLFRRAISGR